MRTKLSIEPIMYIVQTHLNNMSLFSSRAEVEGAILLRAHNRLSRNMYLNLHLNNLELTYGQESVFQAAGLVGLYNFDETI